MKKVSHKMSELSQYLQQPLDDLDSKMSPYFSAQEDNKESEEFVYRLEDDNRQ